MRGSRALCAFENLNGMIHKNMLIGLVVTFNEEKTVIDVLDKLERNVDYIVIVNDGSYDRTDSLIKDWIKDKKDVHYVFFQENRGMSYVLLQGFKFINERYKAGRFSGDDVIVTIDADGQHDADEIKNMHAYFLKNDLDILISRRDFSNYPVYRVAGNKLISLINGWIGKFKFKDIESGFRMLKVDFIPKLLNYYSGFRYSCASEIGVIAGTLKYKMDNSYVVKIPYYRNRSSAPGIKDFFINIAFSLRAVSKIKSDKNNFQ